MYGNDAKYVNVENMFEVAKSMNELFLSKNKKDRHLLFAPPARFLQPGRGSVKGELLLPDSQRGVQRNPAIMCDFGFGFREKTGFGSKLVPFNLSTSS